MKNTTLYFVMDGPDFESGAMLLACSMRRQFGSDPVIEACVPDARRDSVSPLTQALMARMDVAIRYFPVKDAGFASPYPHGNKILAANLPRATDTAIFFDTDTVVTGPFDIDGLDVPHSIFLTPECKPSWGRDDADWEPIYAMFDLPMPTQRVTMFRGRKVSMLPYFNAGLIGYCTAPNAEGHTFPELWLDTAARIDQVDSIPNKRPWLDQIALPIASARLGARFDIRDEYYNYNLYRRDAETHADLPIRLMHYHQPSVYRTWPACVAIGEALLDRCNTAEERAGIDQTIRPYLRLREGRAATATA